MNVEIVKTIKLVLELDEQEAQWLHVVMRNPLWGETLNSEAPQQTKMRKKFFDATSIKLE
jgi:hypothetical protein